MSDDRGRRLAFIVCFVVFTASNIGLALQDDFAALLVLRMVQAAGCSATIALTIAVVADISTSAERGRNMSMANSGNMLGPSLGPTIGGLLTKYLGWRSLFWFLVIYTVALAIVFVPLFPETCRSVVGNGSIPARGVSRSVLGQLQQQKYQATAPQIQIQEKKEDTSTDKTKSRFPNPFKALSVLGDKETCIVILYNSFFFTGMEVIATCLSFLYKDIYGFNTLQSGLCFLALGMGTLIASIGTGYVVDWNFRRHAKRISLTIIKGQQMDLDDFPLERSRLEVALPGHILATLAIVTFGWTTKFRVPLAGPEIAFFFVGFGIASVFNVSNTLLIDLNPGRPGAVIASVNFVRCLLSAAGAAAIVPMINAMGSGWAFTFFGFMYCVLFAVAMLVIKKGPTWRQRRQ